MPKRTFTSDETFERTADIAHYGAADLPNAQPVWSIKDEHGRASGGGQAAGVTVPTGKMTPLGAIKGVARRRPRTRQTHGDSFTAGHGHCQRLGYLGYPTSVAPQPAGKTWWFVKNGMKRRPRWQKGKKVVLFPTAANAEQTWSGRFLPVF